MTTTLARLRSRSSASSGGPSAVRTRQFVIAALAVLATACASLPGIETESPEVSNKDATKGDVMKVGIVIPRALDPADASDPSSQLVARTMCDTVLNLDPETGELVPGIAESWATTTRSGQTTITLKLRQDVYFPDGTQVDARVVADSLSRLAREETAGSMHALFEDVQGYDFIRGIQEEEGEEVEPPGRATQYLTGARVSDPFGIELIVEREDAEWVRRLANPATAVVDDAAGLDDPLEFARRPVCAGPYQLGAAWNPGDEIIRLVRNPEYHGSEWAYTSDGEGYAKEILFYVFDTVDAAYEAYAKGRVDVAPVPTTIRQGVEPVPAPLEEPLPAFDTMQDSYLKGNSHLVMYVGLPGNPDGLFADENLRIALSQAIGRKGIASKVYGDDAVPATGFLPPVVGPAHRSKACSEQIPTTAQPAMAKASLSAAARQLDGQTVPFYFFSGYPSNETLVTAIAEKWKSALGVEVKPSPLEEKDFLSRIESGGFDGPFLMGWDGERRGAPQAYLRELIGTGFGGNVTGFSDPGLDYYFENEIATRGGRAGDGLATEEEQLVALEQAEDLVCSLMPLIPVVDMQSHWLVNKDRIGSARDFKLNIWGEPALREFWVKKPPKQ